VVKLTVNLSDEVAAALKQLAARHDSTMTNELRRVISIGKWLDDEQLKGAKVLIEKDGHIRELLIGLNGG
jgi:plasmid stability protein